MCNNYKVILILFQPLKCPNSQTFRPEDKHFCPDPPFQTAAPAATPNLGLSCSSDGGFKAYESLLSILKLQVLCFLSVSQCLLYFDSELV